jgi:hypothetical protein
MTSGCSMQHQLGTAQHTCMSCIVLQASDPPPSSAYHKQCLTCFACILQAVSHGFLHCAVLRSGFDQPSAIQQMGTVPFTKHM